MKKFLLFIVLLAVMFIFPINVFSLPEDWTLSFKNNVRPLVQEALLKQSTEERTQEMTVSDSRINNIKLNMTKSAVEQALGPSKDKLLNSYGSYWYVYHNQYRHFMMVSYQNNKVDGIYTLATPFQSIDHIQMGNTKSQVETLLGPSLKIMEEPEYRLNINEKHALIYDRNQSYITYYFDQHENHQLVGMKVIAKQLEHQKKNLYANPSAALQKSYETLDYYLINVDRVKRGLKPLRYHDKIAVTALKHSKDMAEHQYFNHINLQKETPFDRMTRDHLDYTTAGENLAYGQGSPIEAHHALMNSLGHRKNILNKDFENVGVGVAFDYKNAPYYTENYITER